MFKVTLAGKGRAVWKRGEVLLEIKKWLKVGKYNALSETPDAKRTLCDSPGAMSVNKVDGSCGEAFITPRGVEKSFYCFYRVLNVDFQGQQQRCNWLLPSTANGVLGKLDGPSICNCPGTNT